jgi:hypothetical protein
LTSGKYENEVIFYAELIRMGQDRKEHDYSLRIAGTSFHNLFIAVLDIDGNFAPLINAMLV